MEEREERGFMDKFYHKGAFHQDDEILKRRVSGKTESAVDINLLPKIMQVKNFGKVCRPIILGFRFDPQREPDDRFFFSHVTKNRHLDQRQIFILHSPLDLRLILSPHAT